MPGFNLADLFERVADAVPDREVIVSPARRLTFAQLDARANRLAHYLRSAGIGPETVVGLCLDDGTDMVPALLRAITPAAASTPSVTR